MEKKAIKSMLASYAKTRPLRFHMPGHKAHREFKKQFPCAAEDITELSFSDSLQHPQGVLRRAEEQVKEAADYITLTNEEEGVAEAIERFVLRGGESVC